MRRIEVLSAVVSVLLLVPLFAGPVVAQEEEGNIARIVLYQAKLGMSQQLEEGVKKHLVFHKEKNDPWPWLTRSYISGEQTGWYRGGTFGHKWSDFDNVPVSGPDDEADAAENIFPYVAEGAQWRYYEFLSKVSKPLGKPGAAAMSEIIVFHVRYGMNSEFMYCVRKFHEAIQKTKWPVRYSWYVLVNGGDGPEYVLVIPHENWASLKGPEKPFPAMLEEAVGRQEAEALLERFRKTVRYETTSLARNRPDLSYQPASQ